MKNISFKKNLFFPLFLSLTLFLLFFWPSVKMKINILQKVKIENDEFFVYTLNDKHQDIKIDTKTNYDKWKDSQEKEKRFFIGRKKFNINVSEPENKDPKQLPFAFKGNPESKDKVEIIKKLLTVPAGTNIRYIKDKKFEKLRDLLDFKEGTNHTLTNIFHNLEDTKGSEAKLKQISSDKPLELKSKFTLQEGKNEEIIFFVTNVFLPIQFPQYLEWSAFGYLWNVLIVSVGSFLYFFSYPFASLGLGIILTTILFRTLTWPIYTKTTTFTMNMNLIQPEIEKVKQKYALQSDPASAQKMQLEILKVYRKNNFSFWGFLVSFLQLPLFISINQTLGRFIVPGGIFETDKLIEKPFLGFIKFNQPNHWFVVSLLSFLVGLTMFFLNKVSFKKPDYLKKPTHHLTLEQKEKAKQSEKTMKIMSWFMILMMVLFSCSNPILSLYWIVGNTYTIFQTLITRKNMEKKYFLLKNKSL
ncbi:Preprotein translocase subunit YidC [Candidatus Phytoplasma australiense]|uniref:Preprotein translocase subunit YidC n=1 Tax=Phytoplasma australiense TaxID=59748 RepID=B1VAN6_PHYAS|nr:Preprotein translocase subunit YidC [Candidatus Phytoplasma australiense]